MPSDVVAVGRIPQLLRPCRSLAASTGHRQQSKMENSAMAWSYRKRIKIIPGIHLNLSKSGISTSIGIRGASLTFSQKGTYLNTGLPGTGLSRRYKVPSDNPKQDLDQNPNPLAEPDGNIFSADLQTITSQDMNGIKEAIVAAHAQRMELRADFDKIRTSLTFSRLKLVASYIFLVGLINKSISDRIKTEIRAKQEAMQLLTHQIDNCHVGLDIDIEPDIKEKHDKLVSSFRNLCQSEKIWDVTSSEFQDTRITRSAASQTVAKAEVRFDIKGIEDIKSLFDVLSCKNANGADIYFYPTFVVMYSSHKHFALVGYNELHLYHSPIRFLETGGIPRDSKVIDKTWSKVNKDGTPDRRFKHNHELPVVRYGQINLRTETGMNEQFQFSNYESSEQFALAFLEYQNTIKNLKQSMRQSIE